MENEKEIIGYISHLSYIFSKAMSLQGQKGRLSTSKHKSINKKRIYSPQCKVSIFVPKIICIYRRKLKKPVLAPEPQQCKNKPQTLL